MNRPHDLDTGGPWVDDETWAPVARASREALALLGHPIEPTCLPGESDPCGASFAMHAMAHLAWLQAIADHQLWHLGPDFGAWARDIRQTALGDLERDCLGPATPETPGNPQ